MVLFVRAIERKIARGPAPVPAVLALPSALAPTRQVHCEELLEAKRDFPSDWIEMKFDVIVAGAGVVGVCVAIHLQRRGRSVLLVDRDMPGTGTSFGNAGLIERQAVVPYAFPREIRSAAQCGEQLRRRPLSSFRAHPSRPIPVRLLAEFVSSAPRTRYAGLRAAGRSGPAPSESVVCLRPWTPWAHSGRQHRAFGRRDDDG